MEMVVIIIVVIVASSLLLQQRVADEFLACTTAPGCWPFHSGICPKKFTMMMEGKYRNDNENKRGDQISTILIG
jgi:hypothetical protein